MHLALKAYAIGRRGYRELSLEVLKAAEHFLLVSPGGAGFLHAG